MKSLAIFLNVFLVITLLITLKLSCPIDKNFNLSLNLLNSKALVKYNLPISIKIQKSVNLENYFEYLDSIVIKYDSLTAYDLSEHLLVRANPWIIDTLQNTDYYRMMARDSFVYNQKKLIVLPKEMQ